MKHLGVNYGHSCLKIGKWRDSMDEAIIEAQNLSKDGFWDVHTVESEYNQKVLMDILLNAQIDYCGGRFL